MPSFPGATAIPLIFADLILTINFTLPEPSILLASVSVSGDKVIGLDFSRNGIP